MTGAEIVPARHARAFRVRQGGTISIATPSGTQVADVWAFLEEDPFEYLSMEHTRSVNSNIFVQTGTSLVSIYRRPMLTVVSDSSPGRHDTVLCPCNAAIYREHGVKDYHRSCTDNLHEALKAEGMDLPFTPGSLNMFMNIPVHEDGSVERLPPAASPGDAVTMRAELDLIVVVSSCPQDITPINGADRTPTDLHVTVTGRVL